MSFLRRGKLIFSRSIVGREKADKPDPVLRNIRPHAIALVSALPNRRVTDSSVNRRNIRRSGTCVTGGEGALATFFIFDSSRCLRAHSKFLPDSRVVRNAWEAADDRAPRG